MRLNGILPEGLQYENSLIEAMLSYTFVYFLIT